MRITLQDGTVQDSPFSPEACAGAPATSVEMSADDLIAMAVMAGRDLGGFHAALRQLSARLPGTPERVVTAASIRFERVCQSFPEAYEAFLGDREVGYLRMRHGAFQVYFPDAHGEAILEASPEGYGEFEDSERERYLQMARDAIADALHAEEGNPNPEAA